MSNYFIRVWFTPKLELSVVDQIVMFFEAMLAIILVSLIVALIWEFLERRGKRKR